MKAAPMIPGGPTETVKLNGGYALHVQLQTLLAGQRTDVVLYALVQSFGIYLCNACETEDEAGTLASAILGDSLNFLTLNFAELRQQIVSMRQQAAANPGTGGVQ